MKAPSAIFGFLGEAAESFSKVRESSLMTILLLLVLFLALLVLLLMTLAMVLHVLRSNRLSRQRELPRARLLSLGRRFHPPIFAVPSRWLAIHSENPQAVQSALGLLRPRPCSWEEGLSAAQ